MEIVQKTDSTNSELLRRIKNLSSPLFLLALDQTAGRGRNRKIWHSEPGASLTFSLAWPFTSTLHELSGVSLIAGLSVAQTLQKHGVAVKLKWPNDILKDNHKLGGILIEVPSVAKQPDRQKNWCIIGIGINLSLPASLEAKIDHPAAAVHPALSDPHYLLADLLNDLSEKLSSFDKQGLQPFVDSWNELHLYNNQNVTVFQEGFTEKTGIVLGIDKYGRLLLECAGETTAISSGDISLRPFEG